MVDLKLLENFLSGGVISNPDIARERFDKVRIDSELYERILALFNKTKSINDNTYNNIVQVGGTGGDTLKTINVSTLASMIVASMEYDIIKTGSKAYTSSMGAYDFFLKVANEFNFDKCLLSNPGKALKKFSFYFAETQKHYPWISKVNKLKEIFGHKLFGKIFEDMDRNEMNSKIKIDGASSSDVQKRLQHYISYRYDKVLILHGYSDDKELYLDEASNVGDTHIAALINKKIYQLILSPKDFRDKAIFRARDIILKNRNNIYKSNLLILQGKGDDKLVDLVTINAAIYINFINDFKINFSKLYNEIQRHINRGFVFKHFSRK